VHGKASETGNLVQILVRNPEFFAGFQHIFARSDMIISLILFFIGLSIFNAVSSMVDSITGSLGVSDSTGLIGVLMIVGGIIGALILPMLKESPSIITEDDRLKNTDENA